MMNKENKLRGNNANARKMQFQRRRKPLHVDPNAAPMNSFFGTVGSPIKMATFDAKKRAAAKDGVNPNIVGIGALAIGGGGGGATAAAAGAAAAKPIPRKLPAPSVNSEAATLDLKQKLALQEEIRKQQRQEQLKAQAEAEEKKKYDAAVKAAEEARKAAKADARPPPAPAAAPAAAVDDDDSNDVATVKNDGNRGRRDRRNSTEFLGAPMEPVQQLKLDGAKKAKIPHFMSAWFNIGGNDAKEAAAAPAAAAATPAVAAPAAKEAPAAAAVPAAVATPAAAPIPAKGADAAAPVPANNAQRTTGASSRSAISQSIDFAEITVGRMIGEGAFGKVHEGKWRGKAVAIKLLICQDLRTDILNEFQSEVEIMSVLRHPNICRLLGACMEPPNRALVVELLQRGSLWGIQAALGVLNRNLRPNIPRDCPPFFSRLMKACWNRQPELRPSFPNIVNAFRAYQASISETRVTPSRAEAAKAAVSASIAAN
ncbi:hypothetical protein PybrP1_000261 [[Pythium] brassicae (nom. inval.)]|nr:hypothetical protein PybrP1_000261 [[Pythium] brassicae (nom. inval.)]